jgi:hypothetical protein
MLTNWTEIHYFFCFEAYNTSSMIPAGCLLAPLPRLQCAPAAPKIIERGIQTALYEVTRKKMHTVMILLCIAQQDHDT